MQRFPAAVIIDRSPRGNRPTVVELPVNRAHAAPAIAPPVLHAVADGLSLQELGSIQHRIEIAGILERLRQIIHNLTVGRVVALMLFHNIGEDIAVFGQGKRFHRLEARERLEAELAGVAEEEFAVFSKRLVAVPYIPVMHVAAVGTVGSSNPPPEDGEAGQ